MIVRYTEYSLHGGHSIEIFFVHCTFIDGVIHGHDAGLAVAVESVAFSPPGDHYQYYDDGE